MMTEAFSPTDQVTYLTDEAAELIEDIDDFLLGWIRRSGARSALPPPFIAARDLDRIDYFRNFPHQANVVSTLRTGEGPVTSDRLGSEWLHDADFVVPSAACYGIYVQYADSTFPEPGMRTSRVACARGEDTYERFRRLRAYYVREYLYLGTPDGAKSFVDDVVAWLATLIDESGLLARMETATDSFFEQGSPKAILQRLSKVKQEMVYRGELAVSSVNYHRNFFGESYNIRLPSGDHVHTACFGAGLERWAAMMLDHCGGPKEAQEMLVSLRSKLAH